jgi:hypothetical protein
MTNYTKQKVIVFITSVVILFYYYSKFILSPNSFLTADAGDGIKAFYVFLAHIKNDSSYSQFEWMNYPYGQTHVFTDGQTLIANLFKFIGNFIPFVTDNAMGIYNLMMIFSFPVCALLLCSIIQRLRLNSWFCILGSIAITFLSPQIFRMFGHPTLSYVFFFPLAWWLFIRFHESENKKIAWSLVIALNSCLWFFIHPYYIMLGSLFYMAYWAVGFFQQNQKKIYLRTSILPFFLQVALPLLVTRLYVSIIDMHQFRSQSPYGFWDFYAEWNTIFIPTHGPFDKLFRLVINKPQEWEGWAYIGLPAVIVAIFSLFKIGRYIVRKKIGLILNPVLPDILRTSVWAAYLILLFSMCLPFQLGMHGLVDYLPFIKQFRSLGRFAWVFYYVFTVYGLYITYLAFRYLKSRKKPIMAYAMTFLYFGIYFSEANAFQKDGGEHVSEGVNYFDMRYLPDDYRQLIAQVEAIKGNYQCLIPLPFYHIGSENFEKEYSAKAIRSSMVVSYWNKIPMLSSSAARSPILEAKNIMQFFSPPWFHKEIQKDLITKKDFLILVTNEELTNVETFWLTKSKFLWKNESFELRQLSYNDVFLSNSNEQKERFEKSRMRLFSLDEFYCTTEDKIFHSNFDSLTSDYIFKGKGALTAKKREFTYLLPREKYPLRDNTDYIISFWAYNKDELRNQVTGIFEQCDEKGENCKWENLWSPATSMIIDGDWSLVQKKIHIGNSNKKLAIILNGDKYSKQDFFVDNFLMYPVGDTVYHISHNGEIQMNNISLRIQR